MKKNVLNPASCNEVSEVLSFANEVNRLLKNYSHVDQYINDHFKNELKKLKKSASISYSKKIDQ